MPSFVVVHDKPLGSSVAAGLNPSMDLVALASADGSVSISVRCITLSRRSSSRLTLLIPRSGGWRGSAFTRVLTHRRPRA